MKAALDAGIGGGAEQGRGSADVDPDVLGHRAGVADDRRRVDRRLGALQRGPGRLRVGDVGDPRLGPRGLDPPGGVGRGVDPDHLGPGLAAASAVTAPPMNPPAPVTATRLPSISIAPAPTIAVEPILAAAMRRSRSRPSPALRATVRAGACACVAAAVVLPLLRRRLRIPAPVTVAACVSGPLALAVLRPRSKRRDVALFAMQMWAFTMVHEIPYDDPAGAAGAAEDPLPDP